MKLYVCIENYYCEFEKQLIYIKGGLYLFSEEPIPYFDKYFEEYLMMVKPTKEDSHG